jgi:lytic murein transglycosylase
MRGAPRGLMLAGLLMVPPALPAVDCGGAFADWLAGLRAEAQAAGIGADALSLIDGIRLNEKVLARDRSQRVFTQDWQRFAGRMVNADRLKVGRKQLEQQAEAFAAAEQQYGVPAAVIAALWGLETDFGAVQGTFRTLDALATLAHDCRRPALFRPQLLAALQLVDRGALPPAALVGAWAGELGQLQLLPADYLAYGADGDGDGRIDLKASGPDVIQSAARLLAHRGWRAGEPWMEEVSLPDGLPWAEATAGRWPRRHWAAWGVTSVTGADLAADGPPAALLLPVGYQGPAFLVYPNFDSFLGWNQSLVYATTAAYFATRLAGVPPAQSGHPDPGLTVEQMKQLQRQLAAQGYDIGVADGVLGAKTRAAVRQEQLRRALPADGWPTRALLAP